ncbi:MAG: hypothetical protein GXP47_04550, partial [Acidobacteria bacterium]|nr:hypothetical protein [Acidobacteriota bacterium]
IDYVWSASGKLLMIDQRNGKHTTDSHPRRIIFSYKEDRTGLLASAKDSAGREYEYTYDAHGRLKEARIARVELDADGPPGEVKESYTWTVADPGGSGVLDALETGGLLRSVEDGGDPPRTVFAAEYDGNTHKAKKISYGEIEHAVAYVSDRVATVTGAAVGSSPGQVEELEWDEVGRLIRRTVGTTDKATTAYRYAPGNWDPLPVAMDLPTAGADEITQQWGFQRSDPVPPRRAWFNLMSRIRSPDEEGAVDPPAVAETTSYEYWGETNLPVKVTLPGGRVWQVVRDTVGRVTQLTDPEGRVTGIEPDALGRILSRKPADDDAYRTSYSYDDTVTGCGETATITPPSDNLVAGAPAGTTTHISYDDIGNPKEVRGPPSGTGYGASVTHIRSNVLGWEVERWVDGSPGGSEPQPGAAGHVWRRFDGGGRLKWEVRGSDELQVKVTRETTEAGLLKSLSYEGTTPEIPGVGAVPEHLTVRFGYGVAGDAPGVGEVPEPSDGLLRQVYHEETGRAVAYAYDERGRRTASKVWDGSTWLTTTAEYGRSDDLPTLVKDPLLRSTRLEYDRLGRRVAVVDPLGRRSFTTYDAAGRPEVWGLEDAGGLVWNWRKLEYNAADQVVKETVKSITQPGTAPVGVDRVTVYTYEGERGLLAGIVAPGGLELEIDHDAAGRVSEERVKDGSTLLTTLISTYWPSGAGAESVERPADPGQGSPAQYLKITAFDWAGRPVQVVRPGGHASAMGYDALGRLAWRQDPGGVGPLLTQVATSALGTKVRVQASGRSPQVRSSDLDGFLESVVEEGGATFTAARDAAGRVVSQELPGGVHRDLFWNGDGTLDHEVLSDGTVISHLYDEGRRLVGRAVSPGVPGHDMWPLAETFSYNPLDQLTTATDDRGMSVSRSWASTGELLGETVAVDGLHTFTTTAAYDDAGRLVGMTYPDGANATLGRDALGRLKSLGLGGETLWSGGYHGTLLGDTVQGLLSLARRHSAEGMPAEVRAVVTGGASQRYRLKREYTPTLRYKWEERSTTITSQSNLSHDDGQRATGWRTDLVGLPELPDGGGSSAASERVSRSFASGGYDDPVSSVLTSGGHSVAETFGVDQTTHRIGGSSTWQYSYGPLGARSQAVASSTGQELDYEHDWASRLLEVANVQGPVADFRYDPLGRRVVETRAGVTTYRVPFGEQEVDAYVEDVNGDLKLRKRLYWGDGVDHLLAYDWDSDLDGSLETRLYPITDDKGTVQAVADEDGTVVESYVYRPDGSFRIFGTDTTAPELLLARIRPADPGAGRDHQRMELAFSEAVQIGGGVLELRDGSGAAIVDSTAWTPSADGRRYWVDIDPALTEGETNSLYLSGMEDMTGNRMAVAPPIDESFTAPAEDAELDLAVGGEGDILALIDAANTLVLVSGSPVDPASLSGATLTAVRTGVQVNGTLSVYVPDQSAGGDLQGYEGRILIWTPDDPTQYLPAEYTLTVILNLTDPAGHPIHAPPSGLSYTHQGQSDIVWSKPSETPILSASTTGNDRYLHGRPYLPELALYDYRARFYEPATSTFLEPDPLGPLDSPNLYQAFGFDGLNVRDPFGECLGINDMPCEEMAGKMIEALDKRIAQEPVPEGVKKMERLLGRMALTPVTGLLSIGGSEGRNFARVEGVIQGHQPNIRNEEELKRRIDQFGWDALGTAGDVAAVYGTGRALVGGSRTLLVQRDPSPPSSEPTGVVAENHVGGSSGTRISAETPLSLPAGENQQLLALPSGRTNPYTPEAPIRSMPAPRGLVIEMAMAPGQTRPGGFGTTDVIADLGYVRNELGVIPRFKPEIEGVQRWAVPEGLRIQWGRVAPIEENGVTYSGGGSQIEILNFADRSRLKPVGPRIVFPKAPGE